jgi:site-specific DNA recombinase
MNCIIYSRVSTINKQDNARAIAELRDYAKYKKYKVLQVFEEKITGTSKALDRPEFQKMEAYIQNNNIKCVLVWELSRLGRKMSDVINTIESFSNRKINIFIKKEGINTLNDKGEKELLTQIIISVLSGFSEFEKETFRLRSISGIRQNVATGGSGTGIVKAYGFKKVGKKLMIDYEEAKVVKIIFNKYLSGLGTMQLAKYLTREKIPTRYNKVFAGKSIKQSGIEKEGKDFSWRDGTIYSMLTNTIYKGDRLHKGEIFKVEPIIDELTFDKVQLRLKENYNKGNSNKLYTNVLKDLLICGKCGRSYFMHKRAPNKEGKIKDSSYKCLSKRYDEDCKNPSMSIDKLQNALFIICADIINSDSIGKNTNSKNSLSEKIDNKKIELDNTKTELVKLSKKIDRLLKLNLAGEVPVKLYTENKTELLKAIEKEEANLQILNTELNKLESLSSLLLPDSKEYSRTIFDNYVKDAVEYIKIYSVPGLDKMRDVFPSAQDVAVLIEVKSVLDWFDNTPILKHFIISQRSENIAFPSFEKDKDYEQQIKKGRYKIDFHHTIKDWTPTQLKNKYMKPRGGKVKTPKPSKKNKV